MKVLLAATLAAALTLPALAQDAVTEPKSGAVFPAARDGMTLLGVGLRVKSFAFVKAKVYALGLYVADSALAGPLAAHKGKAPSEALYRDLVAGDFPKAVVLKFTRDVDQDRIQSAMREALDGADSRLVEKFVGYFPKVQEGQECVLRWAKGGTLETHLAGLNKDPIKDKPFASAVFAIWLGPKPLQDDIKRDLVARFR